VADQYPDLPLTARTANQLSEEDFDLLGETAHVLSGVEGDADGGLPRRQVVCVRATDNEPERDVSASVMSRVDARIALE
jgi:hypothetical protein